MKNNKTKITEKMLKDAFLETEFDKLYKGKKSKHSTDKELDKFIEKQIKESNKEAKKKK